eukprot:2832145-Rhodomonas_salina.2
MVVVVWPGRGEVRKRERAGGSARERKTKGGRGRETAVATCHEAEMQDDKGRRLMAAYHMSSQHFIRAAGRSSISNPAAA